jgi:hypothetical protein
MGRFISILLFLITAFYMLPVKDFTKGNSIAIKAMEKADQEDNDKKEQEKEFTAPVDDLSMASLPKSFTITANIVFTATMHHLVETPPPDFV